MQEIQVKEFNAQDFTKLHILLLKWAKFLGIKETPDEEDIVMLIIFIKEHFGTFTLSMVKDAFNTAIARKLPNIDPEHYQNFSPVYVGGILKAYYDYTLKARKAYLQASQKVESESNKVLPSEGEQGMPSVVEKCVKDPDKIGIHGVVVYDYLSDIDELDLTNEEKVDITKKAKAEVIKSTKSKVKNTKQLSQLISSINLHPNKKNGEVIAMCKKIGLSVFLDKLGDEGRQDLLKNVQIKSNVRLEEMRKREQTE